MSDDNENRTEPEDELDSIFRDELEIWRCLTLEQACFELDVPFERLMLAVQDLSYEEDLARGYPPRNETEKRWREKRGLS